MKKSEDEWRTMVIGTSSQARVSILQNYFAPLFQSFVKIPPDINEKALRSSDPFLLTELVARAKMQAVLSKLNNMEAVVGRGPVAVVTFDQVAVKDGEIREKPVSEEQNRAFLLSYSGSSVKTIAAYVVHSLETGETAVGYEETETFFSVYDVDVVDRVIARGVSMHTAGGFVVEDEDLCSHIVRNVGSIEAVQGVETSVVERLLKQVGFSPSLFMQS